MIELGLLVVYLYFVLCAVAAWTGVYLIFLQLREFR